TTLDSLWTGEIKRWSALISSLIDILFFGAIFYGFNALIPPYVQLGVFHGHCNGTECSQQLNMFGSAYIAGVVSQMCLAPLTGIFMDRIGLRVAKMTSTLIFCIGCFMFAFTSRESSYLLFPAVIFVAVGSLAGIFCNNHISSLFPKARGLVISVQNGAYDSSAVVTFIMAKTFPQISIQTSFVILGCCSVVCGCLIAILFLNQWGKDMEQPCSVTAEMQLDSPEDLVAKNEVKTRRYQIEVTRVIQRRYLNLKHCFLSLPFLLIILYFMPGLLRFSFYFSQLNAQLTNAFNDDHVIVKRLLEASSAVSMCTILISPATGILLDLCRIAFGRRLQHRLNNLQHSISDEQIYWAHLRAMGPTLFVISCLSLFISIVPYIKGLEWLFYVTFVAVEAFASILASVTSTIVMIAFPVHYFGTVLGVVTFSGGIFCLIQYGLLKAPLMVGNAFMIITSLMMFISPTVMLLQNR
ncbi:transporter, major facilitator family protein, partial [Opisthorchis viverrini]